MTINSIIENIKICIHNNYAIRMNNMTKHSYHLQTFYSMI